MERAKFQKIQVKCPRSICAIEDMTLRYIDLGGGARFYAPCDGCDSMNGSQTCVDCRRAITKMFCDGFEARPWEPVLPDLEALK